MHVAEGMTTEILSVGPGHTLRAAARLMANRGVGAAIVVDPESPGLAIITERDLLHSLGAGENPDEETVGDHQTSDVIFAAPDWSLEVAAETMLRGGFRHLIVTDGAEVAGLISVRDIVRVWTESGAIKRRSDSAAA
jgi:signal-transduction protein with cAMP-binding, CBS, and nucleotidyltransferase domain